MEKNKESRFLLSSALQNLSKYASELLRQQKLNETQPDNYFRNILNPYLRDKESTNFLKKEPVYHQDFGKSNFQQKFSAADVEENVNQRKELILISSNKTRWKATQNKGSKVNNHHGKSKHFI